MLRWIGGKIFGSPESQPVQASRPAAQVSTVMEEGRALQRAGKLAEGAECFRKALKLDPRSAEAAFTLGDVCYDLGRFDEAIAALQQAADLDPGSAQTQNLLGLAYFNMGKREEAEQAFRLALARDEGLFKAWNNLGMVLQAMGRLLEAGQAYGRALQLNPNLPQAHNNLGLVLLEQEKAADAIPLFRRAIDLDPAYAEARFHLALALEQAGRLDEAMNIYNETLALRPDADVLLQNLGKLLMNLGQAEEAVAAYRREFAISRKLAVFSDLLFALNHVPGIAPDELFREHLEFGRLFSQPAANFGNAAEPGKRLRIGYLSPDFRRHSVARFIEPVLANHDRSRFEVFAYYLHPTADEVTQRLRSLCDHWLDCATLSDEALADTIRKDGIDILVDLAGHTGENRLSVFARKPAPVQVTWLGYLNTTGLAAMDYRITDRYADPPGASDALHTEKLARLPHSQWCYLPPANAPPVASLPALENGYLTLGSFNNFTKVTPQALALWARILASLQGARILMIGVPEGSCQRRVREAFAAAGVESERVLLFPRVPTGEFYRLHRTVDLALDPFPYSGGTTTCETLWMGVPVLTFPGAISASRSAASVLTTLGMEQFIAASADDYARKPATLDWKALSELRQGMRERVAASPLLDAISFTRNLESLFREMWSAWCSGRRSASGAG